MVKNFRQVRIAVRKELMLMERSAQKIEHIVGFADQVGVGNSADWKKLRKMIDDTKTYIRDILDF